MTFSQRSHEGCIFLDHRASPGFSEEQAVKFGLETSAAGSKVYETPTLGCNHCGMHVILNPQRTRHRGFCFKCNKYICDWCDTARQQSGYVHSTFLETAESIYNAVRRYNIG